jgi:hypothetical protein
MKTKNTSMRKLSSAILILISLIAISCNTENKGDSGQIQENAKPKAPKVDIHTAVITGDLAIIEQHIKAGTDLNQKDPMGGSSPLISASVFGKYDVAEALIKAGADINQKNNEGSTALHTSAFFCHKDIVQLLLDNNIDQSIRNTYGTTALESMVGPFQDVKGFYEMFAQQLGPLGLKIDLAVIEKTRPEIVEMLK